ncbi:MAG: YhcH/YjgK/YiaL family protein [Clostridiaceae bacterium]
MILDLLEHAAQYEAISEGLREAFYAIRTVTLDPYVTGKTEIVPDKLFLLKNAYAPKEFGAESLLEAHRSFIDVMYMVEGEELIYVKPTERLRRIDKPYDPSIEALLTRPEGDETAVLLQKGQFLVLFPQDAHCPANRAGSESVKKIICKVKVDW